MLETGLWAVLGAVLGSTATAAIYRLPRNMPMGVARSRCVSCGATLQPWELVPVLSWVVQRRRCQRCGVRISWLYPAVEVACALTGLTLALAVGDPVAVGLYLVLGVTLLTIAVIDARHLLIPDVLSVLVALLAAISVWRGQLDPLESSLGAAAGFGTLALVRAWWKWRRGVEGIGAGDLKLILGLGAWAGLAGVFVVLGIAGVAGIAVEGWVRGLGPGRQIPLGSYMCFALAILIGISLAF